MSSWDWDIDHIIPKSKGGKNGLNNCCLCHKLCNSVKSNKTVEYVIKYFEPYRLGLTTKNKLYLFHKQNKGK